MPDDDTTPEPDAGEGEPTPPAADESALGDPGKKALDAERKARREAEDALKALRQEIEDKDKTEGEKYADRLAALEAEKADAVAKLLRLEVAAEKGLTPAQAKRLVGTTREELALDADEILEAFPAKAPSVPPSNKPSPSGRGGTDPTEPVDTIDVAKLANAIPRP